MSFKPLKPEQVDVSKIEFGQLKKLEVGASIAYVNLGGKPVYVKTTEFDVPFGAQWYSENEETGKWQVKVNLKGEECDSMVKMLGDLDNRIKEEALKNSVAWFKKRNLTSETIDTLYNPMLKLSLDPETGEPNGKYPPGFAFKIVKRDGNVPCKIYLDKENVYNLTDKSDKKYASVDELLGKGSKVKLLVRCNGIWVANGKFGCTWRAEQIKVTPPENFDDYAFDDSDEEVERIGGNFVESEDEESEEEQPEKKEDSPDEEVEEDSEEEGPEPGPKKRVRKVKKNKQ
jgi:hypothetical protein